MNSTRSTLIDGFGRVHDSLRISVTDRCNLRCVYCMPESVEFLPGPDVLTFDEIERIARIAARSGVNRLRLTGGEPLVRKGLPDLVERLTRIEEIRDIGLTTNGILLAPMALSLKKAGLERINISIDTLDPTRFQAMTRRSGLDSVIEGILAAKDAGFHPIKLNAVAIKGTTENDIVPLAIFARNHGLELRFIEYMPLDARDAWDREKVLLAEEILAAIEAGVGRLKPSTNQDPRAPSLDFDYEDGGGKVGVIASISRPFCGNCNRLRLTADGKLRNCLFALDETDLRALLREGADDPAIAGAFFRSVRSKWEGHEVNTSRFLKPDRLMHAIGG